ncbi:MAG TPA: MraY family glycosyltransferase [Chitinophagaceae bacterium]|nr:undecaprenyl/decaprenyl-phosphate alpha-N-acetylglucosaminyl 1-phosphate transferase [Chitinophagaceae bacterium]MCC6634632.1 undecaprenyl/decaprenyl-phosphate alpha-N-acetylglucosaminyl 1-phosphate transferase [Chitinophagaceae bacterium]HNE93617.1 MraY family glycosyltransferase [Chitinophagaceae bacterium]HNL82956.1 MraY family glycosyltransferase [Chitinophagaceae bacterium]
MEQIILGLVLSFIVGFYAIPVIITVANQKKLYDIPNERKIHTTPVSSLGGLGIFVAFMMGLLVATDSASSIKGFQYLIAAFMVIFFFGIKDDILILSPLKKFIGQIIVACILVFKAELVITNMHGFLGIHAITHASGCLLTIFTIIVIMNAFNLIDGVDGLAGTVSVITSVAFGFFNWVNGDIFYSVLAFSFAASVFSFLIYNYSPAKIFMGDTGAMLSGAVNAILVIHFIATAKQATAFPIEAAPAMGFGVLLMPLLDTLRVFALRMIHGRSPFYPDRNHLHHFLLDRGFSHTQVTLTIAASALAFISLTYFLLPIGVTWVILVQIVIFFTAVYTLYLTRPNKAQVSKMRVIKVDFEEKEKTSTGTSVIN